MQKSKSQPNLQYPEFIPTLPSREATCFLPCICKFFILKRGFNLKNYENLTFLGGKASDVRCYAYGRPRRSGSTGAGADTIPPLPASTPLGEAQAPGLERRIGERLYLRLNRTKLSRKEGGVSLRQTSVVYLFPLSDPQNKDGVFLSVCRVEDSIPSVSIPVEPLKVPMKGPPKAT